MVDKSSGSISFHPFAFSVIWPLHVTSEKPSKIASIASNPSTERASLHLYFRRALLSAKHRALDPTKFLISKLTSYYRFILISAVGGFR